MFPSIQSHSIFRLGAAAALMLAANASVSAATAPQGPVLWAEDQNIMNAIFPGHLSTGDHLNNETVYTPPGFDAVPLCLGVSGKVYVTINPDGSTKFSGAVRVNDTIYAKEVQVLASPFPDYVFDPSYCLRPLAEVEAAIAADHRLPGMPSAQEIEKNGLGVSSMVVKQMEKIEELTLYAIDLKKGNDRLAAENAGLAQRLERLERIEAALNLSAGK